MPTAPIPDEVVRDKKAQDRIKQGAQRAHDLTGSIIADWGPRLPGSEATRKAAARIAELMEQYVEASWTEKFRFSPRAFLSFLPISATAYVLSLIALFLEWTPVAALVLLAGTIVAVFEFVFYREFVDWAMPKAEGTNVIGQIEPEGEVKQQIIVSGHHDSAFIFNYLEQTPRWYFLRSVPTYLLVAAVMVALLVAAGIELFTGTAVAWLGTLQVVMAVGLLLVLPLFFFLSRKGTPGAGDNLIASAMALELARLYKERKSAGSPLKHTRLWFISFDAEEAGLRGSRDFVRRHLDELKSVPTYLFNIDSVYELKHLKFVELDLNGLQPLDPKVVSECLEIARDLGYEASTLKLIVGAGATDAAEFAKAGIPGTNLIAMRSELFMTDVAYHTSRDTIDKVEIEAVEASMEIAEEFIRRKEAALSSGS